jgi:Tfp pilus assembly protein PilF
VAEARRESRQVRRAQARKKQPVSTTLRIDRFAAPLLLIAGIVAYHNALRGPFVLDDLHAIQQNETIRTLWPPWDAFLPPPHSAVSRRPLVNFSLALNYAFDGLNVTSYHVFNLVTHLLVALVLFGIVRRALRGPALHAHGDHASALATAVALLWVVHPLATESVDYTIQRTELLMGLFFMLTLYGALRSFQSPKPGRWYAASLCAFALGLGSKEVIAVAPAIVFVYDWLFHSRSLRDAIKRHFRLYAGYVVVVVLYVLLVGTRLRWVLEGRGSRAITPWNYAKTQCGVIVHYLRLAFWPDALAADYAGWPIATSVASVLPFLVVIGTLLALTLWGLVHRRPLAILGVWFFAILAPTSSFKPLPAEIAAERRMYLPLMAVVVLVVLAGHALFRHLGAPRGAGLALVAGLALTLALVTIRRNDDYKTTLSFWSDVVAKRPDNPRARLWLGNYFYENGRNAEALPQLTAAVHLQPEDPQAQYSLGVVLASQGKLDQAIDRYREALRIDPEYAFAHNNLGIALAGRGEIDEAVRQYREALRILPSHANAHYNLALVLAQRGQTAEAIEHLESALRLKPDFPEARSELELLSRASQ